MSYVRKNMMNVTGSILGVIVIAAIAIWQFYVFVTFQSVEGGASHLWWAIGMTVLACTAGFLVFSVFVRHDTDDDLHITSTRSA